MTERTQKSTDIKTVQINLQLPQNCRENTDRSVEITIDTILMEMINEKLN